MKSFLWVTQLTLSDMITVFVRPCSGWSELLENSVRCSVCLKHQQYKIKGTDLYWQLDFVLQQIALWWLLDSFDYISNTTNSLGVPPRQALPRPHSTHTEELASGLMLSWWMISNNYPVFPQRRIEGCDGRSDKDSIPADDESTFWLQLQTPCDLPILSRCARTQSRLSAGRCTTQTSETTGHLLWKLWSITNISWSYHATVWGVCRLLVEFKVFQTNTELLLCWPSNMYGWRPQAEKHWSDNKVILYTTRAAGDDLCTFVLLPHPPST